MSRAAEALRRIPLETSLSIGLILAWALSMSLGVAIVDREFGAADPSAARPQLADRSIASANRIVYRQYDARGLVLSLAADSLSIVPRQFLLFGIRPINEARVANAVIDLHVRADARDHVEPMTTPLDLAGDLLAPAKGNRPDLGYGIITRGIIDRVSLKVYAEESPRLTLRAERAVVDRPRKPRFLDAVLEDARSDRRISSREIVWDRREKAFLIPGAYLAQTESGHANGRGAKVDLDFHVTPLLR